MLGQAQQLDIFNDSHDVMLRNDLAHALQAQDVTQAMQAVARLAQAYPDDPAIAHGELLTAELLAAEFQQAAGPAAQPGQQSFTNAADARAAQRRRFNDSVVPAAIELLGARAAAPWLLPVRERLAQAHVGLPWNLHNSDDHAAPLWLAAACWQEAADAAASVTSWRRIPTPLSWMLQAQYGLHGLDNAWPLLAELSWLAPAKLPGLFAGFADPLLNRLLQRFNRQFDPANDADSADDAPSDLAWFPAWVLTETPALAQHLAAAQPGQNRRPEQGFRALVNLLVLERQGRHVELLQQRKALRDIHPGLYGLYMATR